MITKLVRETRCQDVLKYFQDNNKGLCFMSLTTPDVVTLDKIRERWRSLRHYLQELHGKGFKYVMNYELHPGGHGWHVHAVFNQYVNLRRGGLAKIRSYGFGSIDVQKVTSLGVANYLSKHALKAYRGVRKGVISSGGRLRLVNTSRGLPRLSDYHWESAFADRVRAFISSPEFKNAFGDGYKPYKYRYAHLCVLMGWTVRDLQNHLRSRMVSDDIDEILP